MGLSSRQVSSDGTPSWTQSLLPTKGSIMKKQHSQKQQPEQLKCPRCDSSNTKFCYYNNYNKSQPRYFCKACKRHWTKGGTLRNVPIGGARKNKRHKASNSIKAHPSTIASTSKTSTDATKSSFMAIQWHQQNRELQLPLPLPHVVEGFLNPSREVYEVRQTPQYVQYCSQSGFCLPTQGKSTTQGLEFPFSSSSSFETTPSSISTSFQSSSIYNNYNGEAMKDPTITSGSTVSQTWQVPITSCGMDMDMTNYWNLDDIDALVSTDLNIPWDDSEIKLP